VPEQGSKSPTIQQVADKLGVTRSRVHQLVSEKCPECGREGCDRCLGTGRRIPAVRLGNQWVIPADWDFSLLEHRYAREPLVDDVPDEAEWLRRRYQDDGLTVEEIAEQSDVAPMTVWRRLKRYGIETRSVGPREGSDGTEG